MARNNDAMSDLLRYNAAIGARKRSTFDKSHSHATTLDSAYLVPVMVDRVVPGDEKKIRVSALARMTTPIHPTMDTANLSMWAFYIPDRLWWSHAKEFYGENLDASFNPDGEYVMPYLKPSQFLFNPESKGSSLSDYLGFPVGHNNAYAVLHLDQHPEFYACAGYHRCYHLIWNEYFRNSSIQEAEHLNTGDDVTDDEWNVIKYLKRVNKLPDFYTSLLREPQAGDDVLLPLGEFAPVVARDRNLPEHQEDYSWTPDNVGMRLGIVGTTQQVTSGNIVASSSGVSTSGTTTNNTYKLAPLNLYADLTNATAATINNIRAAVTIQHLLELDSIAGKRYQSLLRAHFSVFTPDATLQRPEILGSTGHVPIGMRQVLQTSSTDDTSPQGNAAAVSVTNISNYLLVDKAFTEPGIIMVLCAIRPLHSYSQYLDPLFTKLNRYDHYYPVFDNLGNQPLPTSAVYFSDNNVDAEDMMETFGYMPAWTEYKTKQNRVSGLMRPDAVGTLSTWNYSTKFDQPPVLNSEFIEEDPELIGRTIAVQSQPQFLLDCYFEYYDTKSMSVHSIPGLTRF